MFGRKKTASLMRPLPDEDGKTRIFSQALWEGQSGDLLRAAGMNPDEEANFAPTRAHDDARIDAARSAHETRLAEQNAQISRRAHGCAVAAFFILSDDVWNGRHGDFLVSSLGLTPYDPWNVRFLAADARSAITLQSVECPRGQISQLIDAANNLLDELAHEYESAFERAGATRRFADFAYKKEAVQGDVAGIANYLFERTLQATA